MGRDLAALDAYLGSLFWMKHVDRLVGLSRLARRARPLSKADAPDGIFGARGQHGEPPLLLSRDPTPRRAWPFRQRFSRKLFGVLTLGGCCSNNTHQNQSVGWWSQGESNP